MSEINSREQLAGVMVALALSQQSYATEAANLDDVNIVSSATRTGQPIDGVTATVVVVDRKQIEKSGAQTLKDIIVDTAGLVIQYGTFPSASSVSKSSLTIRGVGSSGTLWLIDGRRMSGEVSNPYDMDRIPASIIERIEIVKGPMSALYGADAVGGVINIITKRPTGKFEASVSTRVGSNEDGDGANSSLSADIRGAGNRFRYSLYASSQSSDVYTETENTNTRIGGNRVLPSSFAALPNAKDSYAVDVSYRDDADVNSIGARLEADLSDRMLAGIEFNWFEEDREGRYRATFHPTGATMPTGQVVPAFDVPVVSRDDNERMDISVDLTMDVNPDLLWTSRIYNSKYEKRNDTSMAEFQDFAYQSEDASRSSGMNANVAINSLESYVNWAVNDAHLLTIGAEVREEEREATVFSQNNDLDTRSVAYQALYLQDEWELSDTINLTLAGRYDRYEQDSYVDATGAMRKSNTDSEPTFRFGLVKNFNASINARLNIAQAYRVPDIREMFIQKQTPAGLQLGAQAVNTSVGKQAYDLAAETTNAFELGLFGKLNKLNYQFSVFHNVIDNRIEQVAVDANADQVTDYFTFRNVSEAETTGAELELRYPLNKALNAQLFWTELDTQNKDSGKSLEFNPERVVALALNWNVSPSFSLQFKTNYTGEQFYVENSQDQKTQAYTLANTRATYKFGGKQNVEVFGGVNNLLDETVDKRLGSNVGRFFFAGLRGHFE